MKIKRILIVLSILAATALACNLPFVGGSPSDAPADGQPAGETGEPGGTTNGEDGEPSGSGDAGSGPTAPGGAPATLDLDDPALYAQPELFNSYRTSMDFEFEAEGPITGTILLDSATQVDPYATSLEFYTYGNALFGDESVYTFTQIRDAQYVVAPGFGCQTGIPGIQSDAFDVMLDAGETLTGEAQYAGEGIANGIDTYIYTLTLDNIDPLDPTGKDIREISNGQLHVARDGGYIVRVILEGRGVNELLTQDPDLEGDLYYELNFYDFDVPVTVVIPAECLATEQDTIVPLPEDAANVTRINDDLLTFQTGESVDDMVEFFEEAMPALGCEAPTVSGGSELGTATMNFPGCDGGSIDIIIAALNSDVTQVNVLRAP